MELRTAMMWWSSASTSLPTQSRSRSARWKGDVLSCIQRSDLSADVTGSCSLSVYGGSVSWLQFWVGP